MKRPVRIRTQGVVGAGGEKPPATRLGALSQTIQLYYNWIMIAKFTDIVVIYNDTIS
jgi:hypothetical protein